MVWGAVGLLKWAAAESSEISRLRRAGLTHTSIIINVVFTQPLLPPNKASYTCNSIEKTVLYNWRMMGALQCWKAALVQARQQQQHVGRWSKPPHLANLSCQLLAASLLAPLHGPCIWVAAE